MASNGLIANQAKTEFLVLNEKDQTDELLNKLKVGNTIIQRTNHTKLLGITIEESQEWNEHFKPLAYLKSTILHLMHLSLYDLILTRY